jgi:hypothetical protein
MITTESSASSPGDKAVNRPEISADDVVAWSGLVQDQARRVLASGGPDSDSAEAIKSALAQVEADRANGESASESTMHLQQVLDRDELRRG